MNLAEIHRIIVETTSAAVYVRDRERNIVFINPASEALTGWSATEARGKKCYEVFGDAELRCKETCPVERAMAASGSIVHHEGKLATRSGATHALRVAISPVREGEAIVGAVVLMDDITTLRRVEQTNVKTVMALEREVVRRRESEESLRQSREQLRATFVSLDDLLFTLDEAGTFVDYHQPAAGTLWVPPEQFLGRSYVEVLPTEVTQLVQPAMAEVAATGTAREVDYSLPIGGQERWFSAKLSPRWDEAAAYAGTTVLCRDITHRKALERSLRQSEQFLTDVFAAIQDEISVLDTELTVLSVNQAMEKAYAHQGPLVGKRCYEVYQNRDRPCDPCPSLRALETGALACEVVPRRGLDGGQVGWLELYAFPIVDGKTGQASGVIEYCRDITERRRAEEEKQKLAREMEHAHRLESLGVLAGGIAHDLNNLLMGVLLNADLAKAALPPSAPQHSSIADIKGAARRAADLASELLAFSGRGALDVGPIDLSALVQQVAEQLASSLVDFGPIRLDLGANLPAISADAEQLRQLVLCLVRNASEAYQGRQGDIVVATGVRQCDRSLLASTYIDDQLAAGPYVSLEVTDSGCGMDSETQARVFEPLFTTKPAGRGLGLGIVVGIVRSHGGAITVSSAPGRGTTATVLLPVGEVEVAPSRVSSAAERDWKGSGTVLVVDDEPLIVASAARLVTKLGFEALVATNGLEAVDLFRAHADQIRLVLLDMKMPRMDGEQAFAAIRAIRPDAKVVLSSGYTAKLATQPFAGKGLAGFLQKPYGLTELRVALQRALDGDPTAPHR